MNSRIVKIMSCLWLSLTILTACGGGTDHQSQSNLIVNGRNVAARVDWQKTPGGILFDIEQFMPGLGGRFTPVNMNVGIVAQYGKRIGFSLNDKTYGMVQVELCKMEPPSKEEGGRFWVPRGFIEALLDGQVVLHEDVNLIEVTAPEPLQIGDIIPAARDLSQALEKLDYTVLQGDICLSNAIDICFAGYSPNANGNNAGFPYLCIQAPLPPDAEHAVVPTQFVFTMREDEGFVIIGRTPPACDYYSYRSYLLSRCVSSTNPFARQKIYTQLGDPINPYNIMEDIFYPIGSARKLDGQFESSFIIVSTPDRRLYKDVIEAVTEAGLDQDQVLLDVIDSNLVRLGNDDFADTFNFLHRFSNPNDKTLGEAYINQPTLEILRLTPNQPRTADFIAPFTPRTRGSGITEISLAPAVAQLRQAIIDNYALDYDIRELDTHIWLGKTGAEAIDALEDVLGETRDTLYLNTDTFEFNQETMVVVYGVNHSRLPKTVYNNVSCYGATYANGFGGITNDMYDENVGRNFPSLAGVADMDKLYVWKFARTQVDEETFAVPQDVEGNLKGIDNGDQAFIAFRNYIDPDSPDLIGPDPEEIIFDRAMVLTPKN
jgi:hypothetical protein